MRVHRPWTHQGEFAAETRSVARARAFVTGHLVDHGLDGLVEDVELVVSELAANAVVHAGSPFTVTLGASEGVRCPGGAGPGALQSDLGCRSVVGDQRARIAIVQTVSRDWGVSELTSGGKSVWAVFDIAKALRRDGCQWELAGAGARRAARARPAAHARRASEDLPHRPGSLLADRWLEAGQPGPVDGGGTTRSGRSGNCPRRPAPVAARQAASTITRADVVDREVHDVLLDLRLREHVVGRGDQPVEAVDRLSWRRHRPLSLLDVPGARSGVVVNGELRPSLEADSTTGRPRARQKAASETVPCRPRKAMAASGTEPHRDRRSRTQHADGRGVGTDRVALGRLLARHPDPASVATDGRGATDGSFLHGAAPGAYPAGEEGGAAARDLPPHRLGWFQRVRLPAAEHGENGTSAKHHGQPPQKEQRAHRRSRAGTRACG